MTQEKFIQAMQEALEFGLRYGSSYGNIPLEGARKEKWEILVQKHSENFTEQFKQS